MARPPEKPGSQLPEFTKLKSFNPKFAIKSASDKKRHQQRCGAFLGKMGKMGKKAQLSNFLYK